VCSTLHKSAETCKLVWDHVFKAVLSLLRAAKASAIIFALIAGTIGAYCGGLQLLGNFHVVVENDFYRSAQLNKVALERVIQEYDIKSILNLLGDSPEKSWYVDEIAVSTALGIEHHNYGISANEVVNGKQISEILNIVRNAPKPMLIHCKNGADRSGLVAALYLANIKGVTVEKASGQLSLYYGHFPWLTSRTGAMDDSFRSYEQQRLTSQHAPNDHQANK
jgi:protein tyrosine/serine phosphatase